MVYSILTVYILYSDLNLRLIKCINLYQSIAYFYFFIFCSIVDSKLLEKKMQIYSILKINMNSRKKSPNQLSHHYYT